MAAKIERPRSSTRAKGEGRSARLDAYIKLLLEVRGSDLLLTAGARPYLRVDGELAQLSDEAVLTPEDTEAIVGEILTKELGSAFNRSKDVDFSFNWKSIGRFRGNAFYQRGSMGLALRLIPYEIPSFGELGLPPVIEQLANLRQGLVLVTGPTGCGKSTTLASIVDHINSNRACHILTIEDPIEYVHRHKRSAVNQREIGEDTFSFERALRAALREDPDVLLIGEMRDLEAVQIALTIAETGHLVLATLHTNDTSQALDRIIDVFPGDRQQQIRVQLANSLQGILYQQLIPKAGGGRVAAFEVLMATNAIRNLIREGKSQQIRNVVATSSRDNMQTLEMGLSDLVARGVIGLDDALAVSMYPNDIRKPIDPKRGRR